MASIKRSRGLTIFALTLLVYGLRAGMLLRSPSIAPYFLNLADAFLHGMVSIQNPPSWGYDLIRFHNQWYVAQQPLPALLLMPLAAVVGASQISDAAVSVLCGAISIMLADHVLCVTVTNLTREQRNWLTLFVAFGTVHFALSVLGTVWFLGQIVTIMFVWLLIWTIWRNRPLAAGTCLGLILLGRPSVIPGALIFAVGSWHICRPGASWKCRAEFVSRLLTPFVLAVIFLGWYNAVRFASPLETGYAYIQEAPDIKARFLQYGNFSPAFLPENLWIALLKPPLIHAHCLIQSCPIVEPHPLGMGIIWTSPVLLYAVFAFKNRCEIKQNLLLAASAGLALLPSLLYHNPGSAQFGYRFLLDALPFWIILVARGIKNQPRSALAVLVVYCVVMNLWGATWLIEFIT